MSMQDLMSNAIERGERLTKLVQDLAGFDPIIRLPGFDARGIEECIFCHGHDIDAEEVAHNERCLWTRAIDVRDELAVMQIELLAEILK